MKEKLNKFFVSSIILSIIMFIIGMILIIYPEVSFLTITYILAVMLIVNGIYFIFDKETSILFSSFLTLGVLEVVLGIIMLRNPDIVKTLFPIVVGIVMITKSSLDLRLSLLLNENGYKNWLILFILSILSIVCGIVVIANPTIGRVAITSYIGFIIAFYSLSALVDTFIFKKNIKDIIKLEVIYMFCSNCGSEIEKKYKFCPKCGEKLEINNEEEKPKRGRKKKIVEEVPIELESEDSALEVSSNEKLLGILSYLGILSLIPYFCGDKSEFVKYHATQGLNLFLVSIVYYVLNHLLSLIKITKTVVSFNGVVGTGKVTPFIIRFPLLMCGIFLCIISIMGIIYVCQGEKKDLPVVKDIKIIK